MSEGKDRIDELLEGVQEGRYDSTSMNEFDKMASAAQGSGEPDLSSFAKKQGMKSQKAPKPLSRAENRYEYFMAALDGVKLNERMSIGYRQGYEMAIDRYLGKIDLNRNNLSIVDKMLAQELLLVGKDGRNIGQMPRELRTPLAYRGYYKGLKMVEEILNRSKKAMMKKVAREVAASLEK